MKALVLDEVYTRDNDCGTMVKCKGWQCDVDISGKEALLFYLEVPQ